MLSVDWNVGQQVLILMAILIHHLRLPQRLCIIIHTHTLIRLRLLNYHSHPPIRILHPNRQSIVLTIHMLQPSTTHIHTRMSRTNVRTRTPIPRRLSSLMYILIHIYRVTIRLRTSLGRCQRVIVALEGQ